MDIDRARLVELAKGIRRDTRQLGVVELCDGVLALVSSTPANIIDAVSISPANAVSSPANKPKTDRRAYMCDLMRRRRHPPYSPAALSATVR
jgi:hypothetical protein